MLRMPRWFALLAVAVLLPACGGSSKTVVMTTGPAALVTISGVVAPPAGSAAGATVFLYLVDADLNVVLTRDVTITDAAGAFMLSAGYPASSNTRFLLEAVVASSRTSPRGPSGQRCF